MESSCSRRRFLQGSLTAVAGVSVLGRRLLLAEPEASSAAHPFVVTDLYKGTNHIVKVGADGKIQWTHKASRCHDFWVLPDGHLLYAQSGEVCKVDKNRKRVWRFKVPEKKWKSFSCQPLAEGLVLMGCYDGQRAQLLEVDPEGEIRRTVASAKPGRIRLCRKTPQGTYLVGMYGAKAVVEIDADGKVQHELPLDYGAYMATRLANGNTLIACAEDSEVLEVDKDWKTVWQLRTKDLPGIVLHNVAGIQRLKNGNTVLCNWQGHGHLGEQPQLVEVNRDKKVVWTLFDNKRFKAPAHVQILDDDGSAPKDEMYR